MAKPSPRKASVKTKATKKPVSGATVKPKMAFSPIDNTDAALKEIAVGLAEGRIWTDRDFEVKDVPFHFFPLLFMDPKDHALLAQAGLIYEDISKAAPTGINGRPCFFSMNVLTKADTEVVVAMAVQLKKAKEDAVASLTVNRPTPKKSKKSR